jgi:pyruvate dehydrogenase E2 component (dihydrolipoamide acetyltransferase)
MRVEVVMPRMGQGMEEGTILNWLKATGEVVNAGEPLIEIESDKAMVEVEAFATGRLLEILIPAGKTTAIGSVLGIIETEASATAPASVPAPRVEPSAPRRRRPSPLASPVARKMAQQHNLDLTRVAGSAPGGMIVKRDILAAIAAAPPPLPPRAATAEQPVQRVPLSRQRQIAAERMTASKTTIPHFYLTLDVEMTRALDLRESLRQRGHAISVNDLILKATALALQEYPALNATCDNGALVGHESVNLALAVAMGERTHPTGLVTPVIHHCENLSLRQIAAKAAAISVRAREGKLTPDDLASATFTVSNLGMYGIRQFQAIINPPQVAILAVGAIHRIAAFDEQDRARPLRQLTLTLSADHRATDGAEAAGFLGVLQAALHDGFVLAE